MAIMKWVKKEEEENQGLNMTMKRKIHYALLLREPGNGARFPDGGPNLKLLLRQVAHQLPNKYGERKREKKKKKKRKKKKKKKRRRRNEQKEKLMKVKETQMHKHASHTSIHSFIHSFIHLFSDIVTARTLR